MDQDKHILKGYQFYNLPKYYEKKDYQELCEMAVDNLKTDSEIVAVYLEGTEWVPGISDLDILVVYKNGTEGSHKLNAPWDLSDKAKYIFIHHYGLYDETSFEDLYYLIPDVPNQKRPRLLWGQEIRIRSPKDELSVGDFKFLDSILIFDLLINKLLLYTDNFIHKKINVRRLLAELYSLTYTLKMLEIISGKSDSDDFSARIGKLKNDWFVLNETGRLEELVLLLGQGMDVIFKIVEGLERFTIEQSLPPNKNLIFKSRNYYIVFDEDWKQEKFLAAFINDILTITNPFSGRIIKNYKLALPGGLSYFLMAYADGSGTFNFWMREKLFNYKKDNNLSVPESIRKHIAKTNNLIQASLRNDGLFKIPFSYGFMVDKQTLVSKAGERMVLFLRNFKK